MTPLTQSKILRALQDQQFERVGGTETIRTNVRLIAATHGDLEQLVAAGKFRSDLYYRLSVFTIKLPPLQERGEDLALLTDYFLRRFSRELGKNVQTIDPETMEKLQRYRWPGNIRELQSVLKQSLLQATGPVLLPEFLPAFLRTGDTQSPSAVPGSAVAAPAGQWERFITDRLSSSSENLYAEWLAVTDRLLLTRVLRHTGGNQVQAARILGITRGTLRAKIRALGIIPDLVAGTEDTTAD